MIHRAAPSIQKSARTPGNSDTKQRILEEDVPIKGNVLKRTK